MGVFGNLAQKAGGGIKNVASKPLDIVKGEVGTIASQLDPRNMLSSAISDSGLSLYTSALSGLIPKMGGSSTPKLAPAKESPNDDEEERETNQLLKSLISITSSNVDLTKEILAKNSELVELAHVQKPDSFDALERDREIQRKNRKQEAINKKTSITNNNGSVQSALLGGLTGASIASGGAAGISAAIAAKMGGAIKNAVGIIFKPATVLKAFTKIALPVAIVATLGAGIIGAWETWQETGDLSKSLLSGLDSALKFLTFDLIGVEDIQASYDKFSKFFEDKVVVPIKNFFSEIQNIFGKMTTAFNNAINGIKLKAADVLEGIGAGGIAEDIRQSVRTSMTTEQATAFDNVRGMDSSDTKLVRLARAQRDVNETLEILDLESGFGAHSVSREEYNKSVNLTVDRVAREYDLNSNDKTILLRGRLKEDINIPKPIQNVVKPLIKEIYSSPAVIDPSAKSSPAVIIQQNNDNKSVVNNSTGNSRIMDQFRHKPVSTSPNLSSKWESEGLLGN